MDLQIKPLTLDLSKLDPQERLEAQHLRVDRKTVCDIDDTL